MKCMDLHGGLIEFEWQSAKNVCCQARSRYAYGKQREPGSRHRRSKSAPFLAHQTCGSSEIARQEDGVILVENLDADLSHIRWTPTNKKPHKARIAIEDIREVRLGKNTEQLRLSDSNFGDLQDECLFSVIYGDDYETLDLVASCADDANIWVTGLMALTSTKCEWLGSVFDEEDPDRKGFIDENTAVQLIRQTNPTLALSRIKNKVKEAGCSLDAVERGKIHKDEFVELYKPFSKYFIASSHKTYLVEDQQGPANVDGLTSALKRNCRVIELDLWDPTESNGETEPMVKNGLLALSKIPLSEALKTIRQSAFDRSRYPLILRLSVHCSCEWQKVAAKLLVTHLGTKLYLPSADPTDWNKEKAIPTPWDFQQRILIMEKWVLIRQACDSSPEVYLAIYLRRRKDPRSSLMASARSHNRHSQQSGLPKGKRLCCSSESGEVSEDDDGIASTSRRKSRRIRLCRELSDLVPPFFQLKTLQDLMATAPNSQTMNPRQHVAYLSETTALRLTHTYAQEFAQTSRDYVVCVSPNVTRSDSSNLNPQEFWNHGIQMVGINYQTPGLMVDLQEGRFAENGGCGYVLKPSVMNEDLFVAGDKLPNTPQILHLRILSGQQLPRPRGSNAKGDSSDPFVVIEVFGIPGDCAEERTKTVRNDGDDFIGQYTVPFECLQPGRLWLWCDGT
ncbi:Phosphatidylinositol-specific phospholipase C, Y domain protein [Ancylostoma ceylanicum]|uniref:Phosphoinositide phospholipase C n=1 Tax=Ancylostoma ceylanicum TaxID=53326 RepID=A0A0D6L826_9BILA|nr:Phosphatidylinositol-specific phospholipase C, Y domain protein [Ancylostoma ceylanicum]